MKTQVIQLDQHDDLISIRDKMSWSKSGRILLVFPRRNRMLPRPLDLQLLQRHAHKLGTQLALVPRSERLRENAEKLAIPVFHSVGKAQRQVWPPQPRPDPFHSRTTYSLLRQLRQEIVPAEPPWRNLRWVRLLFFSAAVASVLALLLLLFPGATLKLSPKTQLQSLSIPVSASLGTTSVNLAGSLPARLASTVLQKMKSTYVNGSVAAPDKPAAGQVTFRNLTDADVGIPAGTVVRTEGASPLRFATLEDAVLPGPAGETVDVPVQALLGGAAANLGSDSLVVIEGGLGADLAVTNADPLTGGTDRNVSIQTESDRQRLYTTLASDILSECKFILQEGLAPGDLVFPATLKISQEISSTWFPPVGQPGDSLTLTLNVRCQLEYASGGDLERLAAMAMDLNIPRGLELVPGSPILFSEAVPQTDASGVSRWQLQAERLLRQPLDKMKAIQLAAGRTPASAARKLSAAMALEKPPVITLEPSWWFWLPVFPFRFSVLVEGG